MDSRAGETETGIGIDGKTPLTGMTERLPLPPWNMYTVAVSLFAGYILVPLIVSNMIALINPFLTQPEELLVQQTATVITWGVIFAILHLRYGSLGQYIGLLPPKNPRYLLWETIRLLAVVAIVLIGLSFFLNMLQQVFPSGVLGIEEPYGGVSFAEQVVLVIFAVFFAPILEELIFRGLVQSTFHKISTPIRSVFFTSLVFLLLHGSYYTSLRALASVLSLGLCFGIWRERTQSLIPGMIVHLINNILASYMMFKNA